MTPHFVSGTVKPCIFVVHVSFVIMDDENNLKYVFVLVKNEHDNYVHISTVYVLNNSNSKRYSFFFTATSYFKTTTDVQ